MVLAHRADASRLINRQRLGWLELLKSALRDCSLRSYLVDLPLAERPAVIRAEQRASGEAFMAQCEVCGNDYDKAFQVVAAGRSHVFDSFECAIHKLAPSCAHCGCRIVGHGVEADGTLYCCASCARSEGVRDVADRV